MRARRHGPRCRCPSRHPLPERLLAYGTGYLLVLGAALGILRAVAT